jgi:hypothetical protein
MAAEAAALLLPMPTLLALGVLVVYALFTPETPVRSHQLALAIFNGPQL